MNRKIFEQKNEFNIYKKDGKIIREHKIETIFDNAQDIRGTLQKVQRDIYMLEQQKKSIESTLENFKKEEQVLLAFLKDHPE